MELHQLRYFVAVAETGSFTRAAARCLVAQPSLSQQIQKLEKSLRKPLFDRLGKCIRLTQAGETLLPRARQILGELEDASRALREEGVPGQGRLTIGAIPTIGPYWLPPLLTRFLRRYPKVEVQLREDVTAELVGALHQGELDLALVALPIDDASLESVPLWSERLQVALPRGHRLAKQKAIRLADLEEEPFILLSDMHCLSDQVVSFCQSKFVPKITCRCVQLMTIQQMIGLGLGVSLLPDRACQPALQKQIAYRPLAGTEPTRSIGAVRHRLHHPSPNVKALLEMTGAWAES